MGQLKRDKALPFTPWLHMFKSPALWALIAAQYGHDWGFYAMNSDLNKYFQDVQKFDTKSNGMFAAMPFAVMWVFSIASGIMCDWLVNTGRLDVTKARVWFTVVGEYLQSRLIKTVLEFVKAIFSHLRQVPLCQRSF